MNVIKELWRGKDLYRIFMNTKCVHHTIKGRTLDVGSGVQLASYHRFLKRDADAVVEQLDLGFKDGSSGRRIDLEKDVLSQSDASVDTVLLFNVLEHIYNYQHLLAEINRVLKPGGQILGVVPFLVAYHPDPHDYWRFTKEALEKIFQATGFSQIEIISFGYGPATASLSQIEPALPRVIKIIAIAKAFLFDWMLLKFRPKMNKDKFALGLFFVVKK